jgi:hypothetical protein
VIFILEFGDRRIKARESFSAAQSRWRLVK